MSLSYIIITTDDAFAQGLLGHKPICPGWAVLRVEDGKPVLLGTDTGEIEDKNFVRDFAWVINELNYSRDFHKKGKTLEPAALSNEIQADIRKRREDYLARRNGATTPEARAIYKAKLLDLRSECTHPNTNKTSNTRTCLDCGANIL